MKQSDIDIDALVKEKMKQYELDHTFKVETKYGNTYVFCKEYDYITQKSEEKLRSLFHLMNVEYYIQPAILQNFSFILEGEDRERADFIQRFINNGYILKW